MAVNETDLDIWIDDQSQIQRLYEYESIIVVELGRNVVQGIAECLHELFRQLHDLSCQAVVIDMQHVEYVDATGIGLILKVSQYFETGCIALTQPMPVVQKSWRHRGLLNYSVFQFQDTLDLAIKHVRMSCSKV